MDLDPSTIHFVFLKHRHVVEDSYWPRFTLLGQSIGSMYLAWEAMTELMPDLYIGECIGTIADERFAENQ